MPERTAARVDDIADDTSDVTVTTEVEGAQPGAVEAALAQRSSTDPWVVRAVVLGLVLIALVALVGGTVLVAVGKDVPATLWTISGTAVGGLGTLLARTGS